MQMELGWIEKQNREIPARPRMRTPLHASCAHTARLTAGNGIDRQIPDKVDTADNYTSPAGQGAGQALDKRAQPHSLQITLQNRKVWTTAVPGPARVA